MINEDKDVRIDDLRPGGSLPIQLAAGSFIS